MATLSLTPGALPRFEHDCEECTFLGHALYGETPVDVYTHFRESRTEIVGRFGNEGPDYVCVPSLGGFTSLP